MPTADPPPGHSPAHLTPSARRCFPYARTRFWRGKSGLEDAFHHSRTTRSQTLHIFSPHRLNDLGPRGRPGQPHLYQHHGPRASFRARTTPRWQPSINAGPGRQPRLVAHQHWSFLSALGRAGRPRGAWGRTENQPSQRPIPLFLASRPTLPPFAWWRFLSLGLRYNMVLAR